MTEPQTTDVTGSTPSTWADPRAVTDLRALVARASVSAAPDSAQQAELVAIRADLMSAFGAAGLPLQEVALPPGPDGQAANPILYGRLGDPADGRPVVLLYAHYDVVRADDAPWQEPSGAQDPFAPVESDGRLYGRGAADDKSGIVMHLSTLRAFGGRPPVNVVVLLEGEEEIGTGSLDAHIEAHPDLFQAQVIVIADTGNAAEGTPTVTTSLRGLISADVTVSTLQVPVHSGMFGGPAPDAFLALVRILDTLTDWRGEPSVRGLGRYTGPDWPPSSTQEEELFRTQAGVLDQVRLTGSGSITQRLAGTPSINVVGLDGVPSVAHSVNRLQSQVTARISVRIAPAQDPEEAFQALRTHVLAAAPYGITPDVVRVDSGPGFHLSGDGGRYFPLALRAVGDAYPEWTRGAVQSGLGGTIPMINKLASVQHDPEATVVMWGCEEPRCRIHSSPESVSLSELTRMTRAEVNLLQYLADASTAPRYHTDASTAVSGDPPVPVRGPGDPAGRDAASTPRDPR